MHLGLYHLVSLVKTLGPELVWNDGRHQSGTQDTGKGDLHLWLSCGLRKLLSSMIHGARELSSQEVS